MGELSDWKKHVLPGLLADAGARGKAEGYVEAKAEVSDLIRSQLARIAELETARDVVRAVAVQECIKTALDVGNFRDMKYSELTTDYGQPRYDMMRDITVNLKRLSPTLDLDALIERGARAIDALHSKHQTNDIGSRMEAYAVLQAIGVGGGKLK